MARKKSTQTPAAAAPPAPPAVEESQIPDPVLESTADELPQAAAVPVEERVTPRRISGQELKEQLRETRRAARLKERGY